MHVGIMAVLSLNSWNRVSVYIKSLTDRHVIADFSMNSYLGGLRVRTENDGRKIKKFPTSQQ